MLKLILFMFMLIPLSLKVDLIYNIYGLFFFFFFFFCSNFLNSHYYLIVYIFGMDKLSYIFCCLSIWICLLISLSNLDFNLKFVKIYSLYMNFLLFMLILVFSVMDFFYFYFFFESSLLPVFLILFGWGYQPERLISGYYLIFYTIFSSFPFLLVIFYMIFLSGSFSYFLNYKFSGNLLMFFLMFSFLISFPMFGFHNWLPKAHVEAPVGGSMILAGVLLKLGGYGLIRLLKFVYKFIFYFDYFFISLSLYGCILVSMFCMIQSDLKKMVAYSSVCHMSLVISGIFTMNSWGILGSLVLMLGHGFVSSGLFFLIGLMYSRFSSRSFFILSGMITFFPSLSLFWFLLCVLNMSCPPSINLFSEICIVFSLMSWSLYSLILMFFILFFSACYSLTIFSLSQHGSFSNMLFVSTFCYFSDYLILMFHIFPVIFLMFDMSYFFLFL